MIGTLVVKNLSAKVLFDPGATHSFIYVDLAAKMRKSKKELMKTLLVSTPLGKVLTADKILEKCEIKIGGVNTKNDLVILDLDDFDVILGMDWFSKYHTCIDWFCKIVTFQPEEKVNYVFQGEWIITSPSFVSSIEDT